VSVVYFRVPLKASLKFIVKAGPICITGMLSRPGWRTPTHEGSFGGRVAG
jgi:hypothetical protein